MNNKLEKTKKLAASLNDKQKFEVGDVVVWKDGLKNKKVPGHYEPVVVTRVYDNAVLSDTKENRGSVYFNEPLDMACGLIDRYDDFVEFHFDSRRFQKYSE